MNWNPSPSTFIPNDIIEQYEAVMNPMKGKMHCNLKKAFSQRKSRDVEMSLLVIIWIFLTQVYL